MWVFDNGTLFEVPARCIRRRAWIPFNISPTDRIVGQALVDKMAWFGVDHVVTTFKFEIEQLLSHVAILVFDDNNLRLQEHQGSDEADHFEIEYDYDAYEARQLNRRRVIWCFEACFGETVCKGGAGSGVERHTIGRNLFFPLSYSKTNSCIHALKKLLRSNFMATTAAEARLLQDFASEGCYPTFTRIDEVLAPATELRGSNEEKADLRVTLAGIYDMPQRLGDRRIDSFRRYRIWDVFQVAPKQNRRSRVHLDDLQSDAIEMVVKFLLQENHASACALAQTSKYYRSMVHGTLVTILNESEALLRESLSSASIPRILEIYKEFDRYALQPLALLKLLGETKAAWSPYDFWTVVRRPAVCRAGHLGLVPP